MRDALKQLAHELYRAEIPVDFAKRLLAQAMVEQALEDTGGNQCEAARMLKLHRNTLNRIMNHTGLTA